MSFVSFVRFENGGPGVENSWTIVQVSPEKYLVKHDEMPWFQTARKQTRLPIAENNFLNETPFHCVSRDKILPRFAVPGQGDRATPGEQ